MFARPKDRLYFCTRKQQILRCAQDDTLENSLSAAYLGVRSRGFRCSQLTIMPA
jgi:hypothetical protein